MINVVKIGGNVIDNPDRLSRFLKEFSALSGKKILVHGGGKIATKLSSALGIETRMIDGRRVTDRDTLDIVTMVYAGLINKNIVATLQNFNCDAIGLTGADGNVIEARKRPSEPIDYGFVGDINPADINIRFLSSLMEGGISPIFCAICHDGKGSLLNCNADSIAASVAIACSRLEPVRLTFCFELPGVLADINDAETLIPLITSENYTTMVEDGTISGGMLPKVSNALNAIKEGVDEVLICRDTELTTGKGTLIR